VYPAAVLTPFDHALAVVLAVVFPLRAALFGLRRLRRAPFDRRPRVRRRVYLEAMALQWTLALATAGLWWAQRRDWDGLGLVVHPGRGMLAMALVVAGAAVAVLVQLRAARRDGSVLAQVLERVRNVELMLPHSRHELALWNALAATAGVCEEVLYRGYLFWYAAHWLPLPWALAAASVAFGFGHLYQGWRGMLATTGVGALLAIVYVVSGSVYLAMAAHTLIDLHAGHLTHAALAQADREALEWARAQMALPLDPADGTGGADAPPAGGAS
jgi:uncharacterized protein